MLSARFALAELHRVHVVDVMQVRDSGGCFVAVDAKAEQLRFEAGETVPTGPMFGLKMRSPEGEPSVWEQRVLASSGLSKQDLTRFPRQLSGTRRALLAWPDQVTCSQETQGLRLAWTLPRGTYATSLLREIQKTERTDKP